MLAGATAEFGEALVDENPSFEVHITVHGQDLPTPEEDLETQPNEEEEEKCLCPAGGSYHEDCAGVHREG